MLQLRQGTAVRGVDGYQLLTPGKVHGRRDNLVNVPHRFRTEAFRLTFCLNSVYPTLGQQLFVEFLQFQSGQLVELDFADVGLDVVVDVSSIGPVRGGAHLDFGVVLEPEVHPLTYVILCRLEGIHFCIFLNCLLQLCFYLRLSLAEDVLVDSLAGLRVPPGGVTALPSTVRPLADATLAVGSAFCHLYRLHSATQHTTAPIQ